MCGVVGYIGEKAATPVLINGLRRLEYRGYDSAGLAILEAGKLMMVKRSGKVDRLVAATDQSWTATAGIAHTRWATHGNPTERNAHPHVSGQFAIAHNGIVENYTELKSRLIKSGYIFKSDTDSEVLAHLIHSKSVEQADVVEATIAALREVIGTFGLAVLDAKNPDKIVAARRGSPLVLGIGQNETYIASDASAIMGHTDRVVYLEDDEVAICSRAGYRIVDLENRERLRQSNQIDWQVESLDKGGYKHFLIKEIMEQPRAVTDILRGRLDHEGGTSHLGGLSLKPEQLRRCKRILIIGCGTAYYAGLVGKYLLERMIGIPVDVEYGSEFRYRQAALTPQTLALLISQSGETADTLASLRELRRRGVHCIGLVNVVGSSLAREVDGGIYLHAGPEVSVASTKAFTAQVIAQILFGLHMGRHRQMNIGEGQIVVQSLDSLPDLLTKLLKSAPNIAQLAKKYASSGHAMYLGRDSLYPVALEGSHKLKEVSYLPAEAYPAGEMKHGANALIDKDLLVVMLAPKNGIYAKTMSNLEEVKARGGRLLVIATAGDKAVRALANDVIEIPQVSSWVLPLIANIPLQLLAYYIALERGTDIDQPRNLAKSVTVE